jgi:GR25 family glycosyltransferase involved in LPS biosynthesis
MNIYSIPVYYISFGKNLELEKRLIEQGFTNINHFEAIDGKKLKIKELKKKKMITVRTYVDLIKRRGEQWGIPSLGAVGCTLSHNELWKKCVNENMEHIIIAENDLIFKKKFSNEDLEFINDSLRQPKSSFFGSPTYKHNRMNVIGGTHFCILSKDCCEELSKHVFPIDVQTDVYISYLANIGLIKFNCKHITTQKNHYSLVQTICIKCDLPNTNLFYYLFIFILLFLLLCVCYYFYNYRRCIETKK